MQSRGERMKQQRYVCYLNGNIYGMGDLEYMNELFRDYVVACRMHGNEQVEFRIVDREETKCKSCGSFNTYTETLKADGIKIQEQRKCKACGYRETLYDSLRTSDEG